MKTLRVGPHHSTLVDDDFELPAGWFLARNMRRGGYIEIHTAANPPKYVTRLHRFICQAPSGLFVDHINHDPTDNRRENLRICTPAQSAKNVRGHFRRKRFKCVTLEYGKWRVCVVSGGKRYRGGSFTSEVEAAQKANELMLLHHGQFAALNDVPGFTSLAGFAGASAPAFSSQHLDPPLL